MEVTVTLTQALAVRDALSAQVAVLYAKDTVDPTRVGILAFLDTKSGQMVLRWATEADKPLITALLAQAPTAVEVADITG